LVTGAAVAVAPRRRSDGTAGVAAAQPALNPQGLPASVIFPDDPAYAEARLTFNTRYSRYPAAIVVCSTASEIAKSIRWARRHEIEVRVRSGGHSYEAFSVADGALVIDLSGTAGVAVDAVRREAVVGAGTRLRDLSLALSAHGLAAPVGTCPGVGLGGLALGGGVGFLSRPHGLTCDNVVVIDAVDADGRLVRASEDENHDLFWALRGGGAGGFAVAVAFRLRLAAIGTVARCAIAWPLGDAAAVIDAWQRWAPSTDNRLTLGLAAPGGSGGVVSASGVFIGAEEGLYALLEPLLSAAPSASTQVWSAPWSAVVEELGGPPAAHAMFKNASAIAYEPLNEVAIGMLLDGLAAAPPGANLVGLFPLGGAVAAMEPDATAFPHRRALFDLQYQAYWSPGEDGAAQLAWVRSIRDAMRPFTHGAYANYADADLADWATAFYGGNLDRLRRVKTAWDPDNVFGGPQAIQPTRS
jgi:FAD/FMN-containing dehydrogenase